jgi:plasmid maintenance system antidote protein VapI
MHNPPHPGEIIRDQCLEPLGLSVTDAAKGLGVTPQGALGAAQWPCRGFAGNGDPAGKGLGSTAETWLRMQLAYDLWQAEQRTGDLKVTRFRAPPTPRRVEKEISFEPAPAR